MFMLIMLQNAEKHHSDPNAVGLPLANWGRAEPLLPASDTLAITALANEEWGQRLQQACWCETMLCAALKAILGSETSKHD